jgi:hypothetical protein
MKKFYISIYLMLISALGFSQWTVLNSGTSNDLNSIHFQDANTVMLLADPGPY